uniref:Helicase ATP-binding domain-containing protein n=1 Tax=Anopheles dirus TaxID=7168 RepID=A0A182NPB6_9DIPT
MDSPPAVSETASVDESKLEKQAFKEALKRKRLLQLEALERKLTGFANFNLQRQKHNWRKKVNTLRSIENLPDDNADDVANNNCEPADVFTESPPFIKGTMREHQVRGLNWLVSMHSNNLNGILADEMGLGKTIQSLGMIGYLMHECKLKGPFLIVVPLSTLENWMKEFARFLPSAKVLRGHALGEEKRAVFQAMRVKQPSWNVVLTTYEFLTNNVYHFGRLNFHYTIIDEGHKAKNELTLFAGALRRCKTQSMVLLTGTPIHNNLHELWALLNLLMPAFFNDANNFDAWFKVEDCVDPDHEQTIRLKRLLSSLMLRRTKQDVTPDIPPKVHIDIYMPPTEQTCRWSARVLQRNLVELKPDGSTTYFRIANIVPHLRKAVMHPFLLPGAESLDTNDVTDEIVNCSAKMIVLDKLLARLRARGSKVLIFTQWSIMLDILADYLDWRGYRYCVLCGDTKLADRQSEMDVFNAPDSDKFVFLLTTRAGGLGINLIAADTVIFYDMDFNPQADFQAEDRAHRIGQTRRVHIFRLIVRGSFDELLYLHSERKRRLDASVIKATKSIPKKLEEAAFEYQRTSLMLHGLIDETALDGPLDELVQAMGDRDDLRDVGEGGAARLRDDSEIVLPGVPCKSLFDMTPAATKRKAEDTVTLLSGKRARRSTVQYQYHN